MIFETFARRKFLESRGSEPEIYTYENLPEQLRYQICVAFSEGIGRYSSDADHNLYPLPNANEWWEQIDRICRKEIFSYLSSMQGRDLSQRIFNFVTNSTSIDDVLSIVEICCVGLVAVDDNGGSPKDRGAEVKGMKAIEEVNSRFEQHGIGFQFENKRIIRVDSRVTHAEILKPALALLKNAVFIKANEEFLRAHGHYRSAAYKDCVAAANRSFESMLKAICDKEGWSYGKGDGASELVTKVTTNGLFTHDFDRSFTAYVAMLKAGLPAVRNDAGGHGEGLAAAAVTEQIARFALNLTATNLVFLGECYSTLKKRSR